MMRDKQGVVGGVARALLEEYLVALPIDPVHIKRYFGDLKGLVPVHELVTTVTGGVPVNAAATGVDLERALQYRNHPRVNEPLPAVWKIIDKDVRRKKCLVIQNSAAHEIPNLQVSPSAAVVTHKVRMKKKYLPFDEQSRGKKGGLKDDTGPDTAPQCLCAHALPTFFYELVTPRKTFPIEREHTYE